MIAQWTQWMSTASVQLAVLVIVIGTIAFLGRRLSARLRYALWLLVLLKALLPPFWGTPWSVVNQTARLFPATLSETTSETAAVAVWQEERQQDEMMTGTSETPLPAARGSDISVPKMQRSDYIFAFWFGGAILFWSIAGVNYFRAVNILAHGHRLKTGPLIEMLNRLKSRGIVPQIVLSDSVGSPFLWGLFAPKIAIPADFPGEVSPDEMQSVLLHELTHWKRGDLFVARLELLVQGLFWFHPLVWFAVWQLRRERELSCDEAVLASGIAARQYGGSLLNVFNAVRDRSPLPVGFLGIVGILERKSQFQQRLEEIMLQQNQVRKIGTFGWGLLLFLFLCVLPMAAAQNKPAVSPPSETESSDSLNTTETNGKFVLRVGNVEIPAKPLSAAPAAKRDESRYHVVPEYLLKQLKLGVTFGELPKSKYEELCPELSKKYPLGGVLAVAVARNSPFDKLGVMPDDILAVIDNAQISSVNDVNQFAQKRFVADTVVKALLFRNDQCYYADIPVKAWKAPEPPQAPDGGYATPEGGFTHRITFQAKGDFVPRNAMDYLKFVNPKLNEFRVHAGYFRSKSIDGKLIAANLTSTPDEFKKLIDSIPQFEYVKTERLTKEMFAAYEKTKQESLPPADGGYATPEGGFTHLVFYKAKGDFYPKTKSRMSLAAHPILVNNQLRAGIMRTRLENGTLILVHATDDPERFKKALDESGNFEFVRSERLTKQLYNLYLVYMGEHIPKAEDGGFDWMGHQYLITFKPAAGFDPKTTDELFRIPGMNPIYAAQFHSEKKDGTLIGTFITDDAEVAKEVIDADPKLEFIKAERLTKKMFEAHRKSSVLSGTSR